MNRIQGSKAYVYGLIILLLSILMDSGVANAHTVCKNEVGAEITYNVVPDSHFKLSVSGGKECEFGRFSLRLVVGLASKLTAAHALGLEGLGEVDYYFDPSTFAGVVGETGLFVTPSELNFEFLGGVAAGKRVSIPCRHCSHHHTRAVTARFMLLFGAETSLIKRLADSAQEHSGGVVGQFAFGLGY